MSDALKTYRVDDKALMASYAEQARKLQQLESKYERLAALSHQGGREAVKSQDLVTAALTKGVGGAVAFGAQLLSVRAILSGVNDELREMRDLQRDAGQTQINVARGEAQVIKNLIGVPTDEKKSFLDQVRNTARAVEYPDLEAANKGAAAGLSSSGGDRGGVLDALKATMRLSREAPDELPILMTGALNVKRSSGVEDMRQNIGMMLGAASFAAMPDLAGAFRNIGPAVASVQATVPKQDPQEATREAAAFFAAASLRANDKRGDESATFSTSFAIQLRDLFEKGLKQTVDGHTFFIKPKVDPGTFEGRMDVVADDPRLKKAFLADMSIERQFRISAEEAFEKGSQFRQLMRDAKPGIQFGEAGIAEYEATTQGLETLSPSLQAARHEQSRQAIEQQRELAMTPEAAAEQARKIRDDALRATRQYSSAVPGMRIGADWMSGQFSDASSYTAKDTIEAAKTSLERRQRNLRDLYITPLEPGAARGVPGYSERLDQAKRQDAYLSEQLNLLRSIDAKLNNLDKIDGQLQDRQPSAGPAMQPRYGAGAFGGGGF